MTPEQLAKLYGELDDACGFQPYRVVAPERPDTVTSFRELR